MNFAVQFKYKSKVINEECASFILDAVEEMYADTNRRSIVTRATQSAIASKGQQGRTLLSLKLWYSIWNRKSHQLTGLVLLWTFTAKCDTI